MPGLKKIYLFACAKLANKSIPIVITSWRNGSRKPPRGNYMAQVMETSATYSIFHLAR